MQEWMIIVIVASLMVGVFYYHLSISSTPAWVSIGVLILLLVLIPGDKEAVGWFKFGKVLFMVPSCIIGSILAMQIEKRHPSPH